MSLPKYAAAAAALVVLAAGLAWWGRTPAEAFSPPTQGGRVFTGLAHGYEGRGAELYLVKGGQTGSTVGRIEAGGRFAFALPERLSLPRLTSTMAQTLKNAGGVTTGMSDRTREGFARWPTRPESAVHGLHAGDGWSDLVVEPLEMNVARYAVAYASGAEYGDLFVANGRMGRVATPGDAMVVLVYADRAGRIQGQAHMLNAFGAEVANRWDLELQAGWNLVTSEQSGDMATLRYRSGPLPDDLQWWTLAGR